MAIRTFVITTRRQVAETRRLVVVDTDGEALPSSPTAAPPTDTAGPSVASTRAPKLTRRFVAGGNS